MSWKDLHDFIEGLPPTGASTYYRAIKPRSWWVTPEYVATKQLTYAVELGNWQRGGGKAGDKPKPPKFPEDGVSTQMTREELREKRRENAERLAAARAARGRRRKSVDRKNPGR